MARWEEHLGILILLQRCLDLSEAVEQLSGKQELLVTLMKSTRNLQKRRTRKIDEKISQELKELVKGI